MKTKLLSLFVALICASLTFAHDCKVDGIYYNLNHEEMTAEVTKQAEAPISCTYSGEVIIPSSITYNSQVYSVTAIKSGFSHCERLTSISIPNSVKTIADYAFIDCSSLTSIDVDAANTHYCSVDGVLFNYAKDTLIQYPIGNTRTEYSIPNSVTTIGGGAFAGCVFPSFTIPNFITTIGEEAFANCENLTSIIIPNSVTTIGSGAFGDCSSLTSITIPNSVTTIEYGVFTSCSSLTSIEIPKSITSIGSWAFEGCTSLTSITIPNSVKTIGDGAFYYCTGLASIIIPDSVTTIGEEAFEDCFNLTSITIPNSVTAIGNETFRDCSGLTSIIIPNSVTTIGDEAFYECSGLTSVTIGNSVTSIGSYAFSNCSGLTSITIPNSVTTIGRNAFAYCSGLTSITIPNSVTSIGSYAFSNCSGLTSINIPNSVTTIEEYAFNNVNNIMYNGIATGSPWGAKCVNGYVEGYLVYSDATKTTLCGCSSAAEEITLPASVTTIGERIFTGCEKLTSINVDDANTYFSSIDGVLLNYYKDTLIKYPKGNKRTAYAIPNSVTTIEKSAFAGCSGLTSVYMGNSVKKLELSAFSSCSGLTSITIGSSVYYINEGTFEDCTNLTSITCYAINPPRCVQYAFYRINYNAKVYVPASALEAYQTAEVWKDLHLYPIAAEVTPMDGDNPIVTPSDQDVTITWPITDGTDTYTLTITKNGEVVCVLTFNGNGQLTNIAFAAPGHNGPRQAPAATLTAQGYQFTVTGLTPSTNYNYSVTATDASGKTLAEHKGNFSTTGGTGFKSVHDSQPKMHKVLRNGQILLERNNATYTLMGQKVR